MLSKGSKAQEIFSDEERCSHCNRPRRRRERRWNPETKRREIATTLCRLCQRTHTDPHSLRFFFNSNCRACLASIPEELSLNL
jgi:hypothetical protein